METQKPTVPQYVYEGGMLHYTITDWFYVAPGSESSKIFKTGWHPLKVFNFNHPIMQQEIERIHQAQQECRDRQKVDLDALSRTYITI